jgi:hypothetical protein
LAHHSGLLTRFVQHGLNRRHTSRNIKTCNGGKGSAGHRQWRNKKRCRPGLITPRPRPTFHQPTSPSRNVSKEHARSLFGPVAVLPEPSAAGAQRSPRACAEDLRRAVDRPDSPALAEMLGYMRFARGSESRPGPTTENVARQGTKVIRSATREYVGFWCGKPSDPATTRGVRSRPWSAQRQAYTPPAAGVAFCRWRSAMRTWPPFAVDNL